MTQPPQSPRDPFNGPESTGPPVEHATGRESEPAAAPSPTAVQPPAETEKLPFELQDGEQVIKVARRHWAFLTVHLARDALFGLGPIVVAALIINWTSGFDGTFGAWAIVAMVAWAVFWAIKAYFTWYQYQHDQWIITNQRLVDSRRANWFNHNMSSADLVNVQDMSIKREGIFPTIFRYGDLECQTAGTADNFVLSGIPEPADILAIVDRHRDAARRELASGNLASGNVL